MTTETSRGPGPLIWVVILLAAVAGAVWGIGVAIAVGVAVTALFALIGTVMEQSEKRKRAQRMPPLTDEMRGVFDRMLGRGAQQDPRADGDARPGLHVPRHLVPPTGHHLNVAAATSDMFRAIDAASDDVGKASVLITRCFDNALHCDAREWGLGSAKEAARQVFGSRISQSSLSEMQLIAEEAVRLGYRAATPLDLGVILGTKTDNSCRQELTLLVGRAQKCAEVGRSAAVESPPQRTEPMSGGTFGSQELNQVVESLVKRLATSGHPQAVRVPDPVSTDFLYSTIVPVALAWMCIQRGARDPAFPRSAEFRAIYEEAAQTMVRSHARASQALTTEWNHMMPPDLKRSLQSAGITSQFGGDQEASRARALESLQASMTCVATSGAMKGTAEAEISLGSWASEKLKMGLADVMKVIRGLPA